MYVVLKSRLGSLPYCCVFILSLLRRSRKAQDKLFWRNLIHYGDMWRTASISEIKVDFFVFSVLSDCLHSDNSLSNDE